MGGLITLVSDNLDSYLKEILAFVCIGSIVNNQLMEIDHEIFSMVILSLPLIQEGQLSVFGERMCTIQVNRLED